MKSEVDGGAIVCQRTLVSRITCTAHDDLI